MRPCRFVPPVLVAAVLALTLVPAAPASNWPRFRGPNGTGIVADKDVPVEWSDKDVLWTAKLPGGGHSSPVVWGSHLFVQAGRVDGKERYLVCVDVGSGKVLWTRSTTGTKGATHQKSSQASSTPATDGERVYAAFWDGKGMSLYAYDFQGTELWHRDLGSYTSQHGPGMSPMVHDGKVYLANDQDGAAAVLALDVHTGKTVWEAPRKAFRACYSTPFVLERDGGRPELIVTSTAGVTAYDPQTGSEVWSWSWAFTGDPLRTVASHVHGGGLIFLNSGDGKGDRHMAAVKVGERGDVTKTNLAWQTTDRSTPYVPSMLAYGEHLYYVTDRGFATCHKAATGEVVWSERLGSNFSASPVLIDGKIYAAGEDGKVYVFAAAPKFQLLARNAVDEPVSATPAVADGRLYIRGQARVFCIGKPAAR